MEIIGVIKMGSVMRLHCTIKKVTNIICHSGVLLRLWQLITFSTIKKVPKYISNITKNITKYSLELVILSMLISTLENE